MYPLINNSPVFPPVSSYNTFLRLAKCTIVIYLYIHDIIPGSIKVRVVYVMHLRGLTNWLTRERLWSSDNTAISWAESFWGTLSSKAELSFSTLELASLRICKILSCSPANSSSALATYQFKKCGFKFSDLTRNQN